MDFGGSALSWDLQLKTQGTVIFDGIYRGPEWTLKDQKTRYPDALDRSTWTLWMVLRYSGDSARSKTILPIYELETPGTISDVSPEFFGAPANPPGGRSLSICSHFPMPVLMLRVCQCPIDSDPTPLDSRAENIGDIVPDISRLKFKK